MEATTSAAQGAAAIPEAKQQISDFGRIIGVLTSPSATFADIVRAPKWITPVLLIIVFGVATTFVLNQRVDWHDFMDKQINKGFWADRIPADQKAKIIADGARDAPRNGYIYGTLGNILLGVWLGFVYWASFNVLGGAKARFKTAYCIATHACVPMIVAMPIGMLIAYLKQWGEVDPYNLVASSVASFLPEGTAAWLMSLAGSFELFWIWILCLIAIGFRQANPKRISLGKALGIAIGVWLVGVFVKVSAVAVMS